MPATLHKSVFFVDDDDEDLSIFQHALEEVYPDASLRSAQNGKEALTLLAAMDVLPDVIFLDLNMPIMQGLEFLDVVREYPKISTIPVLVYTTTLNPREMEEARLMGAAGFVRKPESLYTLRTIIRLVLSGHLLPGTYEGTLRVFREIDA